MFRKKERIWWSKAKVCSMLSRRNSFFSPPSLKRATEIGFEIKIAFLKIDPVNRNRIAKPLISFPDLCRTTPRFKRAAAPFRVLYGVARHAWTFTRAKESTDLALLVSRESVRKLKCRTDRQRTPWLGAARSVGWLVRWPGQVFRLGSGSVWSENAVAPPPAAPQTERKMLDRLKPITDQGSCVLESSTAILPTAIQADASRRVGNAVKRKNDSTTGHANSFSLFLHNKATCRFLVECKLIFNVWWFLRGLVFCWPNLIGNVKRIINVHLCSSKHTYFLPWFCSKKLVFDDS